MYNLVNKTNLLHNFFLGMFISFLYMFRETICPSSGEITVSMRHLVFVTLCGWLSGMQGAPCIPWSKWDIETEVLWDKKSSKRAGFFCPEVFYCLSAWDVNMVWKFDSCKYSLMWLYVHITQRNPSCKVTANGKTDAMRHLKTPPP